MASELQSFSQVQSVHIRQERTQSMESSSQSKYTSCTSSSESAMETGIKSRDDSESEFSSEWSTESESSSSLEQSCGSESENKGSNHGPLACFSKPLYTNAKLLDSYLLLYQFFLRHSLSKKVFSELISLVSVHLPEMTSQKAARSLYQLRQFFVTQFSDLIASSERYCSKCHFLYESDSILYL